MRTCIRGCEHALIQNSLPLGEFSVARACAQNIDDHAAVLRDDVVQDHVVGLRLAGLAVIADAEIILSAGNNGRKAGAVRAVLRKHVIELHFVLIFIFSGA